MGTDHLKNPPLTPDEIADATIEFMESIGPALQPWQATTLRAMLAYPVASRFVVNPTRVAIPPVCTNPDGMCIVRCHGMTTCQGQSPEQSPTNPPAITYDRDY